MTEHLLTDAKPTRRYNGSKELGAWEVPGSALSEGTKRIPSFRISLVRECLAEGERVVITGPRDVASIMRTYLADTDREKFVILFLDTKNKVIGLNTVSVGDLSSSVVHPREVFKAAILASAASIIGCHNHPSGDPTPSAEDIGVTKRLMQAGEILGIDVLDHIVIGDACHISMKERGLV